MNARRLMVPLCAVALCVAANSAVAAPKALEGWGPYKFGMTAQQVINTAKGDIGPDDQSPNALDTLVEIGRSDTLGRLSFDPISGHLYKISLQAITACSGSEGYFAKQITEKFGAPESDYKHNGYKWYFGNGYMIYLSSLGRGGCALVFYEPVDRPPPKAGF